MPSTVSLPHRHLRPTRRAPAPPKPTLSSPTSTDLTLPALPAYQEAQPAAKHVRTRSLFTPSLKSLRSPAPSFRTLRRAPRPPLDIASREAEEGRRTLGRPESLISLERFVREELGDGGGWSSLKTTGQSGKGKLMKRKPLPVLLLTTDGGDDQDGNLPKSSSNASTLSALSIDTPTASLHTPEVETLRVKNASQRIEDGFRHLSTASGFTFWVTESERSMRLAEGQVGADDPEPTLVMPDRLATPIVHSPTKILTANDLLPFPPPLSSPPTSPSPFQRTLSLLSPRKSRRAFSTAAAASPISPVPHARTRSLDLLTRPLLSPFKTQSFDLPRPIVVPLDLPKNHVSTAQSVQSTSGTSALHSPSPPVLDPPTPPAASLSGQARARSRRRRITTRPYSIPSLKEDLNVQAAILALASSVNTAERHVLCRLGISVDEECGACRAL